MSCFRLIAGILVLSSLNCYEAFAAPGTVVKRPATPAAARKGCDLSASYNAYLDRLQGKILNRWNNALADGKNNVTLAATVGTDGAVTNISVKSSPNNPAAEQAALDAFNASQPLERLPSGSNAVVMTFNFISTSDPHGDSNSSMSARLAPVTAPSAGAPPQSTPAAASPPPAETAPATSVAPSSGSSTSSGTPTGGTYPAASGMPADLGLGSVLPSAPAATPAAVAAPPAEPTPAAVAAPPAEPAPAALSAPSATGMDAVSPPESAPSSTPVGGSPGATEGGAQAAASDSFTPSDAPTNPQGSPGAATYGSPTETTP